MIKILLSVLMGCVLWPMLYSEDDTPKRVEETTYVIQPKVQNESRKQVISAEKVDFDGPKQEVAMTTTTSRTSLQSGATKSGQEATAMPTAPASTPPSIQEQKVTSSTPQEAAYLDGVHQLLSTYVDDQGNVDYSGLKSVQPRLTQVAEQISQAYSQGMNRSEGLAYYINLYNIYTLKLIVDHYPVTSITDIDNGKPWDVRWIKVGDQTLSLNEIEHEIIRPTYQDARIHFAVNCAAASCPPLLNAVYRPETIDDQLEKQTRKFINNPAYNQVTPDALKLSKIFDWYREDFKNPGIAKYVDRYSQVEVVANPSIEFLAYDWSLNKQ